MCLTNLNFGTEVHFIMNEKIQLSKKEIICGRCGFTTHGYEDMIRHLSCTQTYPEENCMEEIIKLREVKK